MKVFFVVTVGRQVDGDMITIRFEDKCFKQASKADEFLKPLARKWTESITTPNGPVQFLCERGIHEAELEEEEQPKEKNDSN